MSNLCESCNMDISRACAIPGCPHAPGDLDRLALEEATEQMLEAQLLVRQLQASLKQSKHATQVARDQAARYLKQRDGAIARGDRMRDERNAYCAAVEAVLDLCDQMEDAETTDALANLLYTHEVRDAVNVDRLPRGAVDEAETNMAPMSDPYRAAPSPCDCRCHGYSKWHQDNCQTCPCGDPCQVVLDRNDGPWCERHSQQHPHSYGRAW